MAVPPRVANALAQRLLDSAVLDVPPGPPYLRVARAAKRREIAETMHSIEIITEEEYGEHLVFEARCIADAIGASFLVLPGGGGGIPPEWYGPAVAAALAPVLLRLDNVEARQANSLACENYDELQAIQNAAGIAMPNFPPNLSALNQMDERQVQEFLEHYELPMDGDNDAQRQRIKKFIGICIA